MSTRGSRASLTRRRLVALGGGAIAAPFVLRAGPAFAAWPADKPVRIVVPFAPGGPTDIMARIVAAHLTDTLKAAFIIENKAGAGGNIGMTDVARAEPDGYTLLITSSAIVVNPSLSDKSPYDPAKDFEPISEMGASPNVIAVTNDLGVNTIAELVALAKKEPDKLNYSSPGIGTTPHLSAELLKVRAGIQMAHVSHNGAGPAVQALLAGTTQVGSFALPPAHPHIVAGKMKALAVSSANRWFDLPNVPTMIEAGYKDFIADTLQGFLAPAKTPKAVIDPLAAAVSEILKRPDVKDRLQQAGFEVLNTGPAGMKARIDKEVPMWRQIVTDAGIKVRGCRQDDGTAGRIRHEVCARTFDNIGYRLHYRFYFGVHPGRVGGLAGQAHPVRGSVRSRRAGGCGRAHPVDPDVAVARHLDLHRESGRCWRQHRHRGGREG